ncbi:MAG: carboxypeptidase-like regulatory domain-containing protein, partial [Bacteroidota bacterium]
MKRYCLLLCVGLLSNFALMAQQQTITGKVVEESTNDPLPGVNILAKRTATGTVTDVDGNYHLTVEDGVSTLVFSSIGYATIEEDINGRNVINLSLSPDIQSLEEIVVVGYGEQKKENLTGSVET